MSTLLRLLAVVMFLTLSLSSAWSQEKGSALGPQMGLEVGTSAPKFTLMDQGGKERSLDEFLKKGKVALVFYRSADWCPFCRKQLNQLEQDLKKTEGAGIQVVGISYDSPSTLKTASEKMKITFPLLSDPESKTIEEYHTRNVTAKGKAQGVPNPGTFLVDSNGIIRAKLFIESYRERHTTEALIKAAKSFE